MTKMILYPAVVLLLLLAVLTLYALREMGASPSAEESAAFEKLPYFRNGQFRNPEPLPAPMSGEYEDRVNLARLLRASPHGPQKPLPQVRLDRSSFPEVPEDGAVYWLGHASAILELNGRRIAVDPVFGNASPIPFTVRRYQAPPLDQKEMPEPDYVLLTHNHYDHLERRTVRAFKKAHFIVPYGLKSALRGWGIEEARITEIGWNESFEQDGIRFTAVEGIHFSGRSLSDGNRTLWNSYVIRTPRHNIFWGGDSGYGKHYAEIGRTLGPFDWAALETDAWNGGWPGIHMFPGQTVQAALDLRAKRVLPIHWGVYDLGGHPWQKSINRIVENAEGKPFELMTPMMGEKLIPGETETTFWWR